MVAVCVIEPVKRDGAPGSTGLAAQSAALLSIHVKLRNSLRSKLILDWSPEGRFPGWYGKSQLSPMNEACVCPTKPFTGSLFIKAPSAERSWLGTCRSQAPHTPVAALSYL